MARCIQSVRLSLQVQQVAVRLTDYYWFPDDLSVCCQYKCMSSGDKGQTKCTIYSTALSFSAEASRFQPLFSWPHSPCTLCFCFHYLPWLSSVLILFLLYSFIPFMGLYKKSYSFVMFLQPEAISTFTSEPALVSFAKFFCKRSEGIKYVSCHTEIDWGLCPSSHFNVLGETVACLTCIELQSLCLTLKHVII